MNFIRDRFKIYLRDKNIRYDVIDACLDVGKIGNLSLIQKRINALTNLFQSEDAEDFLQGFKRANNILAKAEQKDGVEYSFGADVKYMEDVSERELLDALTKQHSTVKTAVSDEDFQKAILAISDLRKPIDFFFNSIQVNSENDIVRRNRLNLLGQIRKTCNLVADLSKIEGQSS
jgi:glycyl-tRNA synthetase beta chain